MINLVAAVFSGFCTLFHIAMCIVSAQEGDRGGFVLSTIFFAICAFIAALNLALYLN